MNSEQRHWVLCGGLASGKSAVRRLLAAAGAMTIDADSVGHEVLEPGGPAFDEVAARWPSVVVEGVIDRSALAGIVFPDRAQLDELEAITHPHIFDTIRGRVEDNESLVVVEIPLLRHGLGASWRRMVVDAAAEVRIRRAVDRGMDEADARARMDSQPSRSEWLAHADLVLPNHDTMDELEETVAGLAPTLGI